MKHGARNDIPARVLSIKRGDVMCQVDVELEGAAYRMSSVMTNDSLDAMGLKHGDRVHVVARATRALLGADSCSKLLKSINFSACNRPDCTQVDRKPSMCC